MTVTLTDFCSIRHLTLNVIAWNSSGICSSSWHNTHKPFLAQWSYNAFNFVAKIVRKRQISFHFIGGQIHRNDNPLSSYFSFHFFFGVYISYWVWQDPINQNSFTRISWMETNCLKTFANLNHIFQVLQQLQLHHNSIYATPH